MIRHSLKTLVSVAAFVLVSAAHAADAAPAYQGNPAKGQTASAACGGCHGPDGNSLAPTYPSLAGQHPAYLFKQMKNFKADASGKIERTNAIMNGMIAAVPTENDMLDIAAYYASQKPKGNEMKDKKNAVIGQKLWRAGDASKGLPACAACHGPTGTGLPAQFPRLAGQHADYTEAQLKAFRLGERANDANKMMRDVAIKMTDAEIRAVSDYIAGLR